MKSENCAADNYLPPFYVVNMYQNFRIAFAMIKESSEWEMQGYEGLYGAVNYLLSKL